jgi:hypothetical protein
MDRTLADRSAPVPDLPTVGHAVPEEATRGFMSAKKPPGGWRRGQNEREPPKSADG